MEESKTHWKRLKNPDYLGAYSLDPGMDMTLTISHVAEQQVKGADGKTDQCTVAHFVEDAKPMILNTTNCKMIASIYNTPYIEEWKGKKITVFAAKIKAFGEMVEALRIRNSAPRSLPELHPLHDRWEGAKKGLANGSITMDMILTNYVVSKENQVILQQNG